jgi:hypothetical protein
LRRNDLADLRCRLVRFGLFRFKLEHRGERGRSLIFVIHGAPRYRGAKKTEPGHWSNRIRPIKERMVP